MSSSNAVVQRLVVKRQTKELETQAKVKTTLTRLDRKVDKAIELYGQDHDEIHTGRSIKRNAQQAKDIQDILSQHQTSNEGFPNEEEGKDADAEEERED